MRSRTNGTDPGTVNSRGTSVLTALAVVAIPVSGLLSMDVAAVGGALFRLVANLLWMLSGG